MDDKFGRFFFTSSYALRFNEEIHGVLSSQTSFFLNCWRRSTSKVRKDSLEKAIAPAGNQKSDLSPNMN